MLHGITGVLRSWGDYGDPIDEDLRNDVVSRSRDYLDLRQHEGGPGFVNLSTWSR
jgi:hypothetical protein